MRITANRFDWSQQCLHQSQKLLDKLYRKLDELKDVEAEAGDVPETIMSALCDDLNTPLVIAEVNKLLKEQDGAELKSALLAVGDLLGILQRTPQEWFCKRSIKR